MLDDASELQRQLEINRSLAENAGTVAGQLREIKPPERYEAGHSVLIEFYVETQRFFSLEAERISSEIAGTPETEIVDSVAESANRLLDLRRQVIEALPFLGESTVPQYPDV
jgi:hypothetical protein